MSTPTVMPSSPQIHSFQTQSMPSSPRSLSPEVSPARTAYAASRPKLGAKPMATQSFDSTAFTPAQSRSPLAQSVVVNPPYRPSSQPNQLNKPNYDLSLPAAAPMPSFTSPMAPAQSNPPFMTSFAPTMQYSAPKPAFATPPLGGGGILAPSKPPQKTYGKPTSNDWADFDPLA